MLETIPLCNRRGIPCLQATAVNLSTSALTITFANHPFTNVDFQGLIAVKILQTFTPPTTAVPVVFNTEGAPGSTKNLVTYGGGNITTDTIVAPGIYLVFYDRASDVMQLISSI